MTCRNHDAIPLIETTNPRPHLAMHHLAILAAFTQAALAAAPQAQPSPSPQEPLSYPAGAEIVVARVHGEPLSLGSMLRHIDEHHAPGMDFMRFIEREGKSYFESPIAAQWVRNYADVMALRHHAEELGLDLDQLPPFVEAAKKGAFEADLSAYAEARARRGLDFDPSQDFLRARLSRFERHQGLQTEVQGLLDFIVQDDPSDAECEAFYRKNTRVFGGVVETAHILVHTRDPRTGLLLDAEGLERARVRVQEIASQLAAEGSDFAEIARRYSDDSRTASRGGSLGNVERFDPRLPAQLARTAWTLRDGEISAPIETRFGVHFLRRETLHLKGLILYHARLLPDIRKVMRMQSQEDLLLAVRAEADTKLRY